MKIELLRQKILQLAISGQLVEQDPADTPPDIESTVPEEEQPFAIPENWRWVYISDVIDLISGRDLNKVHILDIPSKVPYLTGASQIINGELIINRWTNHASVISQKGDVLITCKGTIGKVVINAIEQMHIARQIMALRPKNTFINNEYVKYFLRSLETTFFKKAQGVIPGIDRKVILFQPIPLPPLAEQKRIVEKMEAMFEMIDTLAA